MDLPDHAKQACATALSMMNKLKEINTSFHEQGLPPIDIGIGINTGDMSVGNMGSDIVRSYTVMGDSVNLGSRLEGINKEYGTHIIISEFTYADVKDDFTCREVDWVKVKGKLQPVRIYELMGERTNDPNVVHHLEAYQKGFEAYHAQRWDVAIQHFQNALKSNPQDKLSSLYISRCESFKQNPPSADWDGVFEMKTK